MTKWGARWQAFRFPMDPEKQALLRARWESLPNDEKTTQLMADILEKIGAISTMTTDSVAGGSRWSELYADRLGVTLPSRLSRHAGVSPA